MTKLGLVWMPRDSKEAVRLARRADAAGFYALGICDSPVLYEDVYPATTACLLATERLRVGPNVTNPVTRHWTTHAATLRAHETLAPGRGMLGIGPGDGAVYAIGRKPADDATLEKAVAEIRAAAPAGADVQVAAGGPRRAALAGRVGSGVILGTGLDVDALSTLGDIAAAEAPGRIERWGLVHVHVVADETDLDHAAAITRPLATAYARHALTGPHSGKNIPEAIREPLRQRLGRYSFATHAAPGRANPNGELLADRADLESYVMERFALMGTHDQCRERLGQVVDAARLDGVWLIIVVADPESQLQRCAEAFEDLLEPGSTRQIALPAESRLA
jgi:alkanesulfonate monooxygenase SsuD/methylene tetrahydromethanopterin reductase-like flavin-dependent oxidoreductase (luciferase family)